MAEDTTPDITKVLHDLNDGETFSLRWAPLGGGGPIMERPLHYSPASTPYHFLARDPETGVVVIEVTVPPPSE